MKINIFNKYENGLEMKKPRGSLPEISVLRTRDSVVYRLGSSNYESVKVSGIKVRLREGKDDKMDDHVCSL